MRKIVFQMTPDRSVEELMGPLWKHIQELELVELLRLDLRQGVKVGVVRVRLCPGSTVQDLSSTGLFDLIEVIEDRGEEAVCLVKVRAPTGFEELREKADLEIKWVPPMKVSRERIVYSFIGEDEQIQKMIGLLKGFGTAVTVSVHEAHFTSAEALAALTPRQRELLVAAKRLGYYDYPRRASAEDVARAVGLSRSTAVEHLRKAENRLLSELLAGR